MNTIATAARQYATRPADERYPTVQAMIDAALYDKDHSAERTYNAKDLRVVPAGTSLALASPKGQAEFTHWSFGQLARTLGAPASYLRELPPVLAAECMNHGLQSSPVGTSLNLLARANGGTPTIRACTSDTYGRVWDAPLYSAIQNQILSDGQWSTPPTWTGEPAGAYRGDRDSFLIVVNGGSIVSDPSARNSRMMGGDSGGPSDGSTMFRGLMIRNSEVGAASVSIERILFRYICGNHMLWGAVMDRQFRRRHIGSHVLRDVMREIATTAFDWTHASTQRDDAIIKALIEHEIASTKEAVVDELRKCGATKDQAESAYARCEQSESASPRSFWGLAQGMTRLSQETTYQDARYDLDKIAAQILAKGTRQYARV